MPVSPMENAPFRPAWWCPGPHLQTLWPTFFRPGPQVELFPERLELPDGDFIDLHWSAGGSEPIVIILHGLEGCSRSPYARGLLATLTRLGLRGVVMHFRGCSGEPNRLARSYHSGDTADLAHLVRVLHEREANVPLAAVGYSLGGNVLLKWLGESRTQTLSAAVAVSVPFELAAASDRVNRGFSRVYQWRLLRSMRARVRAKLALMPPAIKNTDLASLRSFRAFDQAVTAPLHGFRDADHYYATASSRQYLRSIALDTLILHARDDPFMSEAVIPTHAELSPRVELELHRRGGHVGFVGGRLPWRAQYWLEERIARFLLPRLGGHATAQAIAPVAR